MIRKWIRNWLGIDEIILHFHREIEALKTDNEILKRKSFEATEFFYVELTAMIRAAIREQKEQEAQHENS
jgi:hypothetical protein